MHSFNHDHSEFHVHWGVSPDTLLKRSDENMKKSS